MKWWVRTIFEWLLGRLLDEPACPFIHLLIKTKISALGLISLELRLGISVSESEFYPFVPVEYLFLNSSTGELHLLKSPNREEVEKIRQAVTCNVNTNVQNNGNITVYVYDVDDNPPYTAFKESVQILNHNVKRVSNNVYLKPYYYNCLPLVAGSFCLRYENLQ